MARKIRKHSILMLPGRQVMTRGGRFLLLTVLIVLLVMGRNGNPYIQKMRMQLADVLVPVLSVVSAPLDAVRSTAGGMKNWAYAYQQSRELKAENRELLKWQALAKDMQVENDKLRKLLHVAPRREASYVTATIVSDHGSSFSSAALINAGTEEGVAVNQAAISERGLIGRVIETGKHSAKLLLLTDMNSRIPVMNERTREKMILMGKATGLPMLSYVSTDSNSRKGDRIITSGDGGVFPKNIPVGIIRDDDKSAMQVELFADMASVEYVSVIQFNR
jgi:rod shape-determining protein MreC